MPKVSQSTIARRLGLSRQAVGCALGLYTNTNIKLNAATRERIVQTAKEMGYRPNRLAQIISGRKSGVIGVMNFGGVAQMSAQLSGQMAAAIRRTGYEPMLYDVTWYQTGGIETVTSALLDNVVEGIVLLSPTEWLPAAVLESIRRDNIPVVSIGGVLLSGVPHVESYYEEETYQLTNGLLQRGFRKLLYLSSWSSPVHDEVHCGPMMKRLRGFSKSIEEQGGRVHDVPQDPKPGKVDGEIYYSGRVRDWSDPYLVGDLGMRQVLARRNLPDVVLCANDDWAAGALRACGQSGVRVPQDIALVGNDGTVMSGYGYIPLTTVVQPLEQLADRAMDLLQRLIRKETIAPGEMHIEIPGEVVWRDSTARLEPKSQSNK